MWAIYDYLKPSGQNDIAKWTKKLAKTRRAKLKAKLDVIRRVGLDASNELLADIGNHLYKLKVGGSPQLRPILCRGVVDNNSEFTILIGAKEKDGNYEPFDAIDRARKRRAELLENPSQRIEHEEVD